MFIDVPSDNWRVATSGSRPDATALAAFKTHTSANIGDAQDRLNPMSAAIKPQWGGARRVGAALTVLMAFTPTRLGAVLANLATIDQMEVNLRARVRESATRESALA
ncbi:hypothetical protein ACWCW7_22645 [Nocardia tengchongensis]